MTWLSIADRAELIKGQSTGFDYLRIFLSVAIVAAHSASVYSDKVLTTAIWNSNFRFLLAGLVPMFFALSGYLVSSSLERNNIIRFVGLRILRIVPALAFEVILCALVLGVVFTKLPLIEYFTSREFIVYFGNIVGRIHYTLPGVFDGKQINVQLWTIPYELECYIALTLIAISGLFRRRWLNLVLIIGATSLVTYKMWDPNMDQSMVEGRALVLSFLSGVLVYQFRDRIPFSASLAASSAILCVVLLSRYNLTFLVGVPIAYLTAYLGLQKFKPIPFGDLSYGVYLFHYPILRALNETTGNGIGWVVAFAIVLVISAGCALISWHLIERPLLERKRAILGQWVDDLNSALVGVWLWLKRLLPGAPKPQDL